MKMLNFFTTIKFGRKIKNEEDNVWINPDLTRTKGKAAFEKILTTENLNNNGKAINMNGSFKILYTNANSLRNNNGTKIDW